MLGLLVEVLHHLGKVSTSRNEILFLVVVHEGLSLVVIDSSQRVNSWLEVLEAGQFLNFGVNSLTSWKARLELVVSSVAENTTSKEVVSGGLLITLPFLESLFKGLD